MNSINVSKPKGLGDTIHNTLKKIGVKPFKGCNCAVNVKRLNRLVPYK